uniref:WD repeat domain 59 n=1 Tax=Timema douglasi TaxID=61478 RepID=A0A7R8Z4X7_TIMDO|nr:unnamed protein product [Timema douglasi]
MAVDWTGVYVLLAGRRCLAIKQLDDTSETLHKVPRQSKYEVGSAEWNPNAANKELCAISTNQRVEIFTWQHGVDFVATHNLRSHTRVVTDLNWHRFDPNILATCSIDTFIYLWDIRDLRRPSLSLSAVAGATQIHGLDWSPTQENQIATSSQDCTVKFFDVNNPRRAESILTTSSPVWRARYTPFGEGLVTVVVPQLRRGENSLLLWNISNQTSPVHTFVGHTDVVLEFEWRKIGEDTPDYQLITWSKDQSLRIWKIEPFLQKLCGQEQEDADSTSDMQENGDTLSNRTTIVAESSLADPLLENGSELLNNLVLEEGSEPIFQTSSDQDKEVTPSPTQPKTLQQEFSLININIPNVHLDGMDAVRRTCTVTVTRKGYLIFLQVTFPPNYPYNATPAFQFGQGTNLDSMSVAKLLKIALSEESENKSYLRLHSQASPFLEQSSIYSSFQDAYIPFPRTSGAKFCSAGLLVCFGRPPFSRRMSTRLESPTPRSLSALGGNLSSFNLGGGHSTSTAQYSMMYSPAIQTPTGDPLTSFFFQERHQLAAGILFKSGHWQHWQLPPLHKLHQTRTMMCHGRTIPLAGQWLSLYHGVAIPEVRERFRTQIGRPFFL